MSKSARIVRAKGQVGEEAGIGDEAEEQEEELEDNEPETPSLPQVLPPETLADAFDLVVSTGAQNIIDVAGQIAATRASARKVGARDLFTATLVVGQQAPTSDETADSWLYDWLAGRVGRDKVDAFVSRRAPNIRRRTRGDLPPGIGLTSHARAVLGRASIIAQMRIAEERFGVRHVLAALILPDRNKCNENVVSLARRNFDIDLADAKEAILKRVTAGSESGESIEAWQKIIFDPPPSPIITDSESSRDLPVITLSGFTSDSLATGDTDPLGIDADVKAFARLICLVEATPPLSICLFGEWGSGKSTFMERLQHQITKLCEPKADRPRTPAETGAAGEPQFVENIVQIRFNAWHFADANLWASLTAVFFDQLRRGGHDGGRAADYQALIGRVADRVRSLEAVALRAEKHVEDAKRKSDAAQKALDSAESQLAASDFALASEQLTTELKKIQSQNGDQLREVGRRVYRDDLAADSEAFTAAVVQAASVPGQIALIGRVLVGGGWPTVLCIAAIVIVAGLGIGLRDADPTSLAVWFQRLAPLGGAVAALGALWQAFRSAEPILKGAWKYAKAVESAREKLTKEIQSKRQTAKVAAVGLADAEKNLAQAQEPLLPYGKDTQAHSPATILRYFLFEDGDVREYDKQVGIVSRARRSFEQLNAIVAKTRRCRSLEEKAARRGTLPDSEREELEQWRRLPSDKGPLRVPDRIVLYIDDLDRCTHEQVYAVLQAIHLLLAFELFVVVVGVDVRWIEGAVAKHFEADVVEVDEKDADKGKAMKLARRKRAIDYLEKIFQIPFWLDRLRTEDINGKAPGGTYAAYIRKLLEKNEKVDGKKGAFVSPGASGPGRRGSAQDGGERDADADADQTEETADRDGFQAIDAALASMRLEKGEIDILASSEIGLIASKSPRSVKRLVNIYRIVRARLSEAELEEFLGQESKPPLYPIVALLAAVETGQSVEVADALYAALKLLDGRERLDAVWTAVEQPIDGVPNNRRDALELITQIKIGAPHLGLAIQSVDRLCRPKGATVEIYLKLARVVRRYSFNRYH